MMMTTSKREKRKSRVPKTKMLRKKESAKEERKPPSILPIPPEPPPQLGGGRLHHEREGRKRGRVNRKERYRKEREDICVEGRSRQGNKGEEKQNNIDHPRPKHVPMSMCVVTGSGQNKQEKPERKSSSEHQIKRRGLSLSFYSFSIMLCCFLYITIFFSRALIFCGSI